MSGARSFAWYRGPAVPAPSQGKVMPPPAQALFSASAAMQFDRSTGVFDQTYAAAWQLGRSLALADHRFGPRLMGLRRKAHQIWDEFCDLLFFAESGELTVDIAKLAPSVRKLIGGQVDLPAVDAFLDSAFDHLAGPIAGTAEAGKSDGNMPGEAIVVQKHASDRSRAGKPTGQEISLAFRKNDPKWPNVLDIAQAARKHSIDGSAEFALQLIKKPRRLILKVPNNNDG